MNHRLEFRGKNRPATNSLSSGLEPAAGSFRSVPYEECALPRPMHLNLTRARFEMLKRGLWHVPRRSSVRGLNFFEPKRRPPESLSPRDSLVPIANPPTSQNVSPRHCESL